MAEASGEQTSAPRRSTMIDLHCHILPGIDDGAPDLAVSIEMAKAFVADGVSVIACTPHILPGLYHNTGPQIRQATERLQQTLNREGISLQLVTGADNHIVPDFVAQLRSGHLLPLANSRYVLVEPPHHVAPPRLEDLFFSLLVADYVPILTHPERLKWISSHYEVVQRLARAGVWMQITAGSLAGAFGRDARYYGERMLDEGYVHILATDAHDVNRRPPNLRRGRALAAKCVGDIEAEHLVVTRPRGVLLNDLPSNLPRPESAVSREGIVYADAEVRTDVGDVAGQGGFHTYRGPAYGSFVGRLRRFFT
jgi:protein-tyrosine phosphatase